MLASPYGILLMGHQQYINRLMGKWIDFAHWETHNNNNNKMNKYVYHLILICFSLYAWEIKRIKAIKCNQPKRMNKKKTTTKLLYGQNENKTLILSGKPWKKSQQKWNYHHHMMMINQSKIIDHTTNFMCEKKIIVWPFFWLWHF